MADAIELPPGHPGVGGLVGGESPNVVAHNLPRAPGPLVGRRDEVRAILALFDADERLVSVTGPGGIGKTRLALAVGHEVVQGDSSSRPAEVWWCELADAEGVSGICDAVAGAAGVPGAGAGAEDPVERLGRALASRGEVLLLLDNFDHLGAHAAATVGRWLERAPEARFLITTRERLRLEGEAARELGPLGLPDGAAAIEDADAVALFVRCAERARSGFTLAPADAPFVAEIVRELDGVPLAIELAAARTAVMGPRALLHRLTSRAEVLARSRRGGPDRHATLEAAIDGSWMALAAWEQDALAQCSVFRGGFSIEAAEAVLDLGAHPDAPAVLDVLSALRDKSVVRAWQPRAPAGELRLGLYASIRDYAARKLSDAAATAAMARHAEHVVATAEAWAAGTRGREGPTLRARVLLERENLLAVVERVLGRGPVTARAAEPALRAILVLASVLLDEGPLETYVRLLDPALQATRDSGADPRLVAHAFALRGTLQRLRGEERAGSRDLVQALALARTLGEAKPSPPEWTTRLEARVTLELGDALADQGELEAAREHHARALAMLESKGLLGEAAHALARLGAVVARLGHDAEAKALLERALAAHRAAEDVLALPGDHRLLGALELDLGRIEEARAHAGLALALAREQRDRRGEALALELGGFVAQLAGEYAAARAAYEAAAATFGDLGVAALEARVAGRLGVLCREEGRAGEAYALLSQARLGGAGGGAARAHHVIFAAHLAGLDAEAGRRDEALAGLERARAAAGAKPDRAALAVVEIERGHVDPGLGAAALAAGAALAARSADVRIAARHLERRLAAGAILASGPPPDDALAVGRGGAWFRLPHGARVGLERRVPLARILDRLAAERLERPGAALGWDALLEAAWPGERVIATAGAHRVRVAVSTLRKLGLREALRTSGDGYLLDPAQVTVRADA